MGTFGLCALTLSATGCSKPARSEQRPEQVEPVAQTAKPSDDLEKLQAAARGTWTSQWGRLVFRDDGRAELELRTHCPVPQQDCTPVLAQGTVRIDPYRLALLEGDSGRLFDAFVDADGKLHVGSVETRVAKLDAQRHGTLRLGTFDSITIADGCVFEDEFEGKPRPIDCRFERDGERTLLRLRLPDGTRSDYDPRDRSFVYLERERLLVSSPLHVTAFQR